jgi:hypothetical protein
MASAPVSRAVVATAARASWLGPTAVLLVIGITAPGRPLREPLLPASAVIQVATAAAAVGLVMGTFAAFASSWYEGARLERRHAVLGIGLDVGLLVMIGIASVVGALSGREVAEELERATRAALRDSPNWNGAGRIGGAIVSVSEVDDETELAKILLRPFGVPYRVLLVSVDNTAGPRDLTIDLEHVTLDAPSGTVRALRRAELASAASIDGPVLEDLPPVLRVPAGSRADGARVFLPRGTSFRDVLAITVRADGSDHVIQGRHFTLAEKRAIDAKRAVAPP